MATVLFIPGFGGNELWHRWPTWTGRRTAWLEPFVLVTSGLEILALSPNADGPRTSFLPSLHPGTAIPFYYPAILQFLTEQGWTVDVGRTDWRLAIAESASGIADQIIALARDGPVRIVAHSRGGLVALHACDLLRDRGHIGDVRQVVTLCSPLKGSYSPVPWLGGWPFSLFQGSMIYTVPGILSSQVLEPQLRSVVTTFPGLYELMPDPAEAARQGDPSAAGLYDGRNWRASGVPVSDTHLANAALRWANVPPWPAGLRVDCVSGYGVATIATSVVLTDLGHRGSLQGAVEGDGVVPEWSAAPAGLTRWPVPVTHQGVLSDRVALLTLQQILKA